MRKIGTFLISSAVMAGAVLLIPGQGNYSMNAVYATSTDAADTENSQSESSQSESSRSETSQTDDNVVVITNTENKSNKKVAYYATPKLVLTGRDIKGDAVKAGEEFEMVLHFKNESNSTKLRNISIKLSSEENQIITTSGSDSIYIENLDKEAECDVTVKMKAKEDLAQKNYSVNVEYNYEDNSKNSFDGTASLTIPVIQEARLGISEVKLSKTELDVEGKTSLSFKINNMGLDTLRNVNVEFSGDTIREITYYAGTIESGASNSVDMTITPDMVGNDDIHIKITFEDATGNVSTYEDLVKLVVNEAKPDDVAEAENEAGVSPALLGGGAIAIIAIIALIAGVVKKIRLKKYE